MNKKGIELDLIGWLFIMFAVVVVVGIGYLALRTKGIGAIEFIKNLLRFGR